MDKTSGMIDVRQVSKSFNGTAAVHNISFRVKEGEIFVLLGTSGCGKTTTLKMLNRLLEADSGSITINGKDIHQEQPDLLRRKIGYVLQNIGLFPHYTVRENIALIPRLLKWDHSKTEKRSRILLKKFNLPPDQYLDLYPDQLSGGQQQRVGFARALMANPPIILMDEPLGALDPITRIQIQAEFKKLDELKGKTIVLVTHDITEAITLGNRICLMDRGQIQQIGTPEELLFQPANEFVKRFFENNRLTYQLNALKIGQLLPYLPIKNTPERFVQVDKDSTMMMVLALVSDPTAISLIKSGNRCYEIGLNSLFRAYETYLKSKSYV